MTTPLMIAIAGAGIGGLSAAVLLARDGHKVSVYDQFEAPQPLGSGLILQETGLTILGEMGLRARTEALGARLTRLYGISVDTGRAVLDVRYRALRESLYGLALQRPVLFDLVYRSALDAGVDITPSSRIIVVTPNSGHLTDGNGKTHGPFDLIVDAMGVRSPLSVRPRASLDYGALWTTLPYPDVSPFNPEALEQRYRRARQMAGVMPSGRSVDSDVQTLTYFWSIKADDYPDWKKTSLSHWKAQAVALWPETAPLLDQISSHEQLTFARYDHRTHWPVMEGRMVHIGDSWHATSPQLGQGANMALLDAYALTHALRTNADLPDQLCLYARLRTGHVRLFQTMSWMFTPVYQSDSLILAWLRDWLAAPLSHIPPAPRILAGMVSGALGAPLRRMGLKAGDHPHSGI